MLRIFCLLLLIISICAGQTQKTEYKLAETVDFYKALELGARGSIDESFSYYQKYRNKLPNNRVSLLDNIVSQIYSDLDQKTISKDVAVYIFKSLFGTSEHYSEEMFYLNRASALAPGYEIPYILRGRHHFFQKEYKKALFEFSQCLQHKPDLSLAYYYRGRTFKSLEEYQHALDDFDHSIQLAPNLAESYAEKFDIHFETGEYLLAVDDYLNAQNIDSGAVKGLERSSKLNNMGVSFKAAQDYEKAILCFSQAVIADPRWVEPYLNRGIMYRQNKNYIQALTDFNIAIELKPEKMEGYYNRAQTYVESEDYKKAEKDLIVALNLTDQKEKIFFELGKFYYDQKNINKAIFNFKETLACNENNLWANYWLGICYDQIKSYREAIIYYRYFMDLVTDDYYKHKIHIQNRLETLKKLK